DGHPARAWPRGPENGPPRGAAKIPGGESPPVRPVGAPRAQTRARYHYRKRSGADARPGACRRRTVARRGRRGRRRRKLAGGENRAERPDWTQGDRMNPLVGLVMGSDSDWPVMGEAAAALEEFDLPFEAKVVSAHRMPTELIADAEEAEHRVIRVIVRGAGGAAHLPGMLASVTPLP